MNKSITERSVKSITDGSINIIKEIANLPIKGEQNYIKFDSHDTNGFILLMRDIIKKENY
jgi:hypothetical protein